MAINKKLIHFKNKENFENEVANNNILDTSICFILDSKEISTHGTIYKTVNWSVLDLGESKEIDIHIPKLDYPYGDFIKSVHLEGGYISDNATEFTTLVTTHENFEPEITLSMSLEFWPYSINAYSNSPSGDWLYITWEYLDNNITRALFKVPYNIDSIYILIAPNR